MSALAPCGCGARWGGGSPDPRGAAEEAANRLAEVGAEVSRRVGAVAVGGDAVELAAGDRPAAPGCSAGDVALDRQVERPGPEE